MNATLEQIIWKEVRDYRLAQKAKQLHEITFVPNPNSQNTTTSTPSDTNKSPFKNAQESQKFYDWVAKTYAGGVVGITAKPNDPKLINLFKKYKSKYSGNQDLVQNLDQAGTGGGSAPIMPGMSITWRDAVLAIIALGALVVGYKLFKGGKKVPKQAGAQGRFWRRLANEMVKVADDGTVVQMATNRNWFRTKFTNLLKINKREVNGLLDELTDSASQITDKQAEEIAKAVDIQYLGKAGFIASKRAMLGNVVNNLNAGTVPTGVTLSTFLDYLHGNERKYIPLIKQRWNYVAKTAAKAGATQP